MLSDVRTGLGMRRVRVAALEAIDGTPIVDMKPVLIGFDPSER